MLFDLPSAIHTRWCRSSFKFWLIDGHFETAISAPNRHEPQHGNGMEQNKLNWIMRAQMNQFLMFLYRSCCLRSFNHLNCIFDIDMSFRCFHLIKSKKLATDVRLHVVLCTRFTSYNNLHTIKMQSYNLLYFAKIYFALAHRPGAAQDHWKRFKFICR